MSAPTPAQPTDPNGIFVAVTPDTVFEPGEGYEWVPGGRDYREARPISEPTIDVPGLRLDDVREFVKYGEAIGGDRSTVRMVRACAEALSPRGADMNCDRLHSTGIGSPARCIRIRGHEGEHRSIHGRTWIDAEVAWRNMARNLAELLERSYDERGEAMPDNVRVALAWQQEMELRPPK